MCLILGSCLHIAPCKLHTAAWVPSQKKTPKQEGTVEQETLNAVPIIHLMTKDPCTSECFMLSSSSRAIIQASLVLTQLSFTSTPVSSTQHRLKPSFHPKQSSTLGARTQSTALQVLQALMGASSGINQPVKRKPDDKRSSHTA